MATQFGLRQRGPPRSSISQLSRANSTSSSTHTITEMARSTSVLSEKHPQNNILPLSRSDTHLDCNDSSQSCSPLLNPEGKSLCHTHRSHPKRPSNLSSLVYFAIVACIILGASRAWFQNHQHHRLVTVGVPLSCHSHNDYWRKRPLFDALEAGCTGVEADVWLRNNELYVVHEAPQTPALPTFTQLYVNPLVNILEQNNNGLAQGNTPVGVFSNFPNQTLILLVDFKEDSQAVFDTVSAQLQPLRERGWLTYFKDGSLTEGPITVVVTGEARLSSITANTTYRDIFLDAPTLALNDDTTHAYNWTNSYYSSVKFGRAFGHYTGYMGRPRIDDIATYVQQAHERGLKLRFWSQPSWPVLVRERLWGDLLDAGVDYLNVDDLIGANEWLAKREDKE
ncbi:Altered inheritance of mitochondria protein 6 [Ceratocystis pirilliformis]|uniref:Altered inheritance of mitochondria protein 6 n=1 Tax=Ceratocystis pirilliformis TaxID=259994 RepID=A0ABR3ZHG7_9PEZI